MAYAQDFWCINGILFVFCDFLGINAHLPQTIYAQKAVVDHLVQLHVRREQQSMGLFLSFLLLGLGVWGTIIG